MPIVFLDADGLLIWDDSNPVTHWRNHIDALRTNLVQVHAHRQMFREVLKAIEVASSGISTTWRNHYARLYADEQIMAIRRLVRGGPGEAALGRLLRSMEREPEAMSAELVMAMAATYDRDPRYLEDARRDFERRWGNGTGHLNPQIPHADRTALFREARSLILWADRTIAHIDFQSAPPPTFGDIDRAIDHATEVFQRYGGLLTRNHYDMDIVLDAAWKVPLMSPLFERPDWLP